MGKVQNYRIKTVRYERIALRRFHVYRVFRLKSPAVTFAKRTANCDVRMT